MFSVFRSQLKLRVSIFQIWTCDVAILISPPIPLLYIADSQIARNVNNIKCISYNVVYRISYTILTVSAKTLTKNHFRYKIIRSIAKSATLANRVLRFATGADALTA